MIASAKINMFIAAVMVLCAFASTGQTDALEISLKSRMLAASKKEKPALNKDKVKAADTDEKEDATESEDEDTYAEKEGKAKKGVKPSKLKDSKAPASLRGKAKKAAKAGQSKFKAMRDALEQKAEIKTMQLEVTAEEEAMLNKVKALRDPKKKMMFMMVGLFLFFMVVLGMRSFIGTICNIFG